MTQPPPREPQITVNGRPLNEAQAMTLRVAVGMMQIDINGWKEEADHHAIANALLPPQWVPTKYGPTEQAYEARLGEISRLMQLPMRSPPRVRDDVQSTVLVVMNPFGAVLMEVKDERVVSCDSPGYVGMNASEARCAAISVMRYRLGSEPGETSADGYPISIELRALPYEYGCRLELVT